MAHWRRDTDVSRYAADDTRTISVHRTVSSTVRAIIRVRRVSCVTDVRVWWSYPATRRLADECASVCACVAGCVAASGSEWQRVAASGSEWQRVAASGSEWQRVAASGSEWQRVAASGSTVVLKLGGHCKLLEWPPSF
jgi:hypothetical protein